jgi:glutathione synthase/RimK-type ligase-like ATP-grasp enzyme
MARASATLCIFGREDDPLSGHTEARARARGHDVLRVAFGRMLQERPGWVATGFDGDAWFWQGRQIEECDGYLVRQYPAPHALLAPPEERDTAAGFYARGTKQLERSSYAQSVIMDLELRGKPVVNPLLASAPFDHKPLQLAVFRRHGLPVPDTLVTNDPAAVRVFEAAVRREGGEIVTKPSAGGAAALLVDDAVRARLAAIEVAPAIFQRRAPGRDVRVTVVGGRVLSCVAIESETLDYRSGEAYRRGEARYVEHALPGAIEAMSLRAAALCHHVLSGIDWKYDPEADAWVLLEANSAPVYLDIEEKTGARITDAVIDWLEDPR